MKKLFITVVALAALASCSESEQTNQKLEFEVITFENLCDASGSAVTAGSATVEGFVTNNYDGVFWGKDYAEDESFSNADGTSGTYRLFNDLLFSTADQNVWFGSYYSNGANWGGIYDSWAGFVVSQNIDTTPTAVDYTNQFSAWTAAAKSGDTFLACYYDSYSGGYAEPTIELREPRTIDHLYVTNSTVAFPYSSTIEGAYLKLIATGYLNGAEVATSDIMLAEGETKIEDWTKFTLFTTEVDKVKFTIESNDSYYPTYFCIDNLTLVK